MKKENGAIIVDGTQVASTLRCCHCGAHWTPQPGSGVGRGFCLKCMAPICGHPVCMAECIPFEAWLEHREGKRSRYTDRILEIERANGITV